MRFIATLARATAARRILEIGCGLGYSALWLADAAGPDGRVQTIDRFPEHVNLARRFVAEAGLAERLEVLVGEAVDILPTLPGPYDLVHDDAWFAREPPYLERAIDLLRPGGLLVMSNWFLLQHAVVGGAATDWSQFAGPDWAEEVKAYAEKITRHPRLNVSFVIQPAYLGLAVRIA
jgi:predicted O-methyltransferase YrrM